MELIIKKLWYGDNLRGTPKVSLRDYWVKKALEGIGYVWVVYRGKRMKITQKVLENPLEKRAFKSKIGSFDYELWDYKWMSKEVKKNA